MDTKQLLLYLLSNYPYYYALLQQCRVTFDEKMDGIAQVKVSTRMEIQINPERFKDYSIAEQAGLLIHELQHVYKDHIKQMQMKQVEAISDRLGIETNPIMANIAMDIEINPNISELVDSNKLGPKATVGQGRGVYPEDFKEQRGDSWFNYYARLKSKAKTKPNSGKGKSGEGQPSPHQDHEYFNQSTKDEKLFEEIAAQAAKRAKALAAGNTPHEIEKFLLDYEGNQQLPWYLVLRQFMQSLVDVKSKNTWKKVNRRFRGKLPGAKKLPKLDLLIGIDSSGSVSDEDLRKFYIEIDAIQATGMCTIDIAVFDTTIHQREEYHKGFEASRICSGGTSFVPVHELAIEERYRGVVYLTDGYAEFPNKDEVTYKCLWVINNNSVTPPYGNVIRIR